MNATQSVLTIQKKKAYVNKILIEVLMMRLNKEAEKLWSFKRAACKRERVFLSLYQMCPWNGAVMMPVPHAAHSKPPTLDVKGSAELGRTRL